MAQKQYSPELMSKVENAINEHSSATTREIKNKLLADANQATFKLDKLSIDDIRNISDELTRQGKVQHRVIQKPFNVYMPITNPSNPHTNPSNSDLLTNEDQEDMIEEDEN